MFFAGSLGLSGLFFAVRCGLVFGVCGGGVVSLAARLLGSTKPVGAKRDCSRQFFPQVKILNRQISLQPWACVFCSEAAKMARYKSKIQDTRCEGAKCKVRAGGTCLCQISQRVLVVGKQWGWLEALRNCARWVTAHERS